MEARRNLMAVFPQALDKKRSPREPFHGERMGNDSSVAVGKTEPSPFGPFNDPSPAEP